MTIKYAVIVAGGSGHRMKQQLPKQFQELAGQPVLLHTIRAFHIADPEIELIIVLPEYYVEKWNRILADHDFSIPHQVCAGGRTRYDSVKNGLQLVSHDSLVAIHDGVRPIVSARLINHVYEQASIHGTAIPVIPLRDSIRVAMNDQNEPADRSKFVLVQTPQCFRQSIIAQAYASEENKNLTDDASLVNDCGHQVHLVQGEQTNIKITYKEDLLFAEALIQSKLS